MFIFIDHVMMRRTLPILFAGFIIGQAVVWLLTPRRFSH